MIKTLLAALLFIGCTKPKIDRSDYSLQGIDLHPANWDTTFCPSMNPKIYWDNFSQGFLIWDTVTRKAHTCIYGFPEAVPDSVFKGFINHKWK